MIPCWQPFFDHDKEKGVTITPEILHRTCVRHLLFTLFEESGAELNGIGDTPAELQER